MSAPLINKTLWDLTPLLISDNDPSIESRRKEIEQGNRKFITDWKERTDYLTDPKVLAQALREYEALQDEFSPFNDEWFYFNLRYHQDQGDTELKAKLNKVNDFATNLGNEIQFFGLNIAKIAPELHEQFLAHPELQPYKHFLEKAFSGAKYLLSDAEEKILNLKNDPASASWVRMLSGFLSKEEREIITEDGKKKTLPYAEISSLTSSKKKETRDNAALALNDIFRKLSDVAEAEINAVLKNKKIDDELRGIERPDLTRHLSDDIDTSVVDTLVETVSARNDISRRFYELKAKLMGREKLAYHERNVEYGAIDKKYSYEDAVSLVYKVFDGLDPEFGGIFKGYVENGQIDVFPRKGKNDGAFCWSVLRKHPTYIFLNHTEKLRDILTIAHEVGHGINAELMRKQNGLNYDTPMSTAEVASTFMEDFVLQEILKGADDELKLSLMMMKLGDDVSTIIRQVAGYKFEQELHKVFREKGYLSKDEIGELFKQHMAAYMGDFVEQTEGCENWWIYWSHFRRFFYVYSYASGLLISKSMQAKVKQDHAFIEKVKVFLSAGGSSSPRDIFLAMGIDINDKEFWNAGLNEVDDLLKETEALAKKLGMI